MSPESMIAEAYRYADLLDHAELHQCAGLGRGDDGVVYGWPLADNPCHDAAALLIAMAEEIAKMRADAERYRWLRDECGLQKLPYDDYGLGPMFPDGEALDAAIDELRTKEDGKDGA
jgi:hypothetical protein